MLSRVAESVYWMSRYIERAENVARVLGVNNQLQHHLSGLTEEQWDPMVKVGGDEVSFRARYDTATRENVIEFLTFDAGNPNSIVACLTRARENARSVREIISSEMWEEVNRFYLFLREPDARRRAVEDPHPFFEHVRRSSHLIEGTKNETMEHAEAWHFSRLGRYVERADQTTRILDVKYFLLLPSADDVGRPIDDLQWSALLRSASAFEAYRRAHGRVAAAQVARFLLFERDFPRSVQHCISAAQLSLHAITGTPLRRFANTAEQALGRLVAEIDYTDSAQVVRGGLHDFLDAIQNKLNGVGNAITRTFFAPRAGAEPGT